MSYSFTVRAPTKAAAKEAALAAYDAMVAQQPIHTLDREAALTNMNTVVDLLPDDLDRHVAVHMNGYVSWDKGDAYDPASVALSGASIAASANLVQQPTV